MAPDESKKTTILKLASQYLGLGLVEDKLTSDQKECVNKFIDSAACLLVLTRIEGKKAVHFGNEVMSDWMAQISGPCTFR